MPKIVKFICLPNLLIKCPSSDRVWLEVQVKPNFLSPKYVPIYLFKVC